MHLYLIKLFTGHKYMLFFDKVTIIHKDGSAYYYNSN